MPSAPGPIRLLLALSFASLVAACATNESPRPVFPSAVELTVPPKPQLTVEAVAAGSAVALAEHNSAIEAWGDSLAAQVARLCRWAEGNGAKGLSCVKEEK